ncbi:MAG: hypothetical protein AAFR91_09855 [Pseudomonadota bacterium]
MTSVLTAWFRFLCVFTVLAILVGCGGAPAEDGGGVADVPDVAGPPGGDSGDNNDDQTDPPPVDRVAQHEQSMNLMASSDLGCANCHSASDGQRGDLNLETGTLEELAARLVGRRSASDNCTDELLIDPNEPEDSLFLTLISPHVETTECIAKMPLGSNGISEADFDVMVTWVNNLIATYREQDDGDFGVGSSGDDSATAISSAVAVAADPLEVVMKVKYLVTGGAVTRDELDTVINDSGALNMGAFETLVQTWLASTDFTTKRQSFFRLALQQNPAIKDYVQQLRNTRIAMTSDVVNNLEASMIRTAERIYSDDQDFRSLFWTSRHEVTTATLFTLKMLDNPVMRSRLGNFDKSNPVNNLRDSIPSSYSGRDDPQFQADLSDWRTVDLRYVPTSEDMQHPDGFEDGSNLAILRAIGDNGVATLRTPRVLCSTPAFFQMWQTNRDNRFRALVNQCLIMALGETFATGDPTTPEIHPFPGVDTQEIPEASECMGCHKNLDPMVSAFEAHFDHDHQRYRPNTQANADFYRQLSGDYYGYDPLQRRNYFPFESFPLPYFSYDGVNQAGSDLYSVTRAMAEHPDFALAWAVKVCSWATSVTCNRQDPEIARIATVFANSGFQLDSLFQEFFTSKLVTHTYRVDVNRYPGAQVSIARRDHYCQAIQVRLREARRAQGRTNVNENTNICGSNQKLSEAIPEESVQRGATGFNLPVSNTPFSSISVGNLCSTNLERLVGGGSRTFSRNSSSADQTISLIVSGLLGFPEQTAEYTEAVDSFTTVYDLYRRSTPQCSSANALQDALTGDGPQCGLGLSEQQSMESIVSLACQSPSLTTIGM